MKYTIKNAFKLKAICRIAGIVALAALIGFSMVACEDGVGGPGGGGGGGSSAAGTLTVTGLPDGYWMASVYPQGYTFTTLFNMMFNEEAIDSVSSDDRDRSFHLWWYSGPNEGETYTGSGNRPVALHGRGIYDGYYIATVNFSNGSATVPFSSFREIDIPNI